MKRRQRNRALRNGQAKGCGHVRCRFCGHVVEPENSGSMTCDGCWYGMRLDPDGWVERLSAQGVAPRYRGGCVLGTNGLGHAAIMCRDPFVPHLAVVREGAADGKAARDLSGAGA